MPRAGDKIYFPLIMERGLKRDGTAIEGSYSNDAQHARVQRGKWRKMGGYKSITQSANWPIRGTFVHTEDGSIRIYMGSDSVLQYTDIDQAGMGGGIGDRTPAGFIANSYNMWQMDGFPDAAAGSGETAIMAHAAPNLRAIDSSEATPVYYGNALANTPLIDTGAPPVSGGICVSPPFCFAYGSDGFVAWCSPNEPATWTPVIGNQAGRARVARQKIVKGLAARSGRSGPGAIFWSLDSVIVAEFTGGETVFSFQTASGQSSIMSSQCVIEYDSIYYWVGVDRFLLFNGVVQELPNNVSINWFFDNLNMAYRQKVWATKVPRYGEIWWHFPFGDSIECNAAIIYNVRENCWYDTRIARSSGYFAQVFDRPIWVGAEPSTNLVRELNGTAYSSSGVAANAFDGDFSTSCLMTSGSTITYDYGVNTQKEITQIRIRVDVTDLHRLAFEYSDDLINWNMAYAQLTFVNYIANTNNIITFDSVGAHRAWRVREFTGGTPPFNIVEVYFMSGGASVFLHESGVDAIIGNQAEAIQSYFETPFISFTREGPFQSGWNGANSNIQLNRIEPDFLLAGNMTVTTMTKRYPNSPLIEVDSQPFDNQTDKIDMKVNAPLLIVRFESNEIGGDYQQGEIMFEMEPTDGRR